MEEEDCRKSNDELNMYAFDTESRDFLMTNPDFLDPESTATLDEVLSRLRKASTNNINSKFVKCI